MKVSGISPDLKFVNEPSMINIKTIPLAPSNPVGKISVLRRPVIPADIIIMVSSRLEPYFSSRIGPIRSIRVKLLIR